jgi:preprotein translocase subunit SecG
LVDKVADLVNQRNTERLLVCGRPRPRAATIRRVYAFLAVLQVIIAGVLIFLILLHSGKDAGLSGAFGIGGGGSAFGGGSMVERNLDRATVFFAVVFVLNTLILLKI